MPLWETDAAVVTVAAVAADDAEAVALLNDCTLEIGCWVVATGSNPGCWTAAVVCGITDAVTAVFDGREAAVAWAAC